MAWAYVQDNIATRYAGTTTTVESCTFDTTATAGSLLVAVVQYNGQWTGARTITPTSGWTEATDTDGYGDDSSYSVGYRAFYKLNAAGTETTFTATFSDGVDETQIWIGEFSGIATSAALTDSDIVVRVTPGTGTDAITSPSLAVADANSLVIGFCHQLNGGFADALVVAGTGFTGREQGGVFRYTLVETIDASAAEVVTFSASNGGTYDYAVGGMVFKPATGGAATNEITGSATLPSVSSVTRSPASFQLTVAGTGTLTVTVLDQYGAPLENATVTVSLSPTSGVVSAGALAATNASGQTTSLITGTGAGTASITATCNGVASATTSALVVSAGSGGAAPLILRRFV